MGEKLKIEWSVPLNLDERIKRRNNKHLALRNHTSTATSDGEVVSEMPKSRKKINRARPKPHRNATLKLGERSYRKLRGNAQVSGWMGRRRWARGAWEKSSCSGMGRLAVISHIKKANGDMDTAAPPAPAVVITRFKFNLTTKPDWPTGDLDSFGWWRDAIAAPCVPTARPTGSLEKNRLVLPSWAFVAYPLGHRSTSIISTWIGYQI